MTFDTTTLIIIGGVLLAFVILIMILARRGHPRVEEKPRQEGYVASKDRPYVKPPAVEPAPGPTHTPTPAPAPEPEPASRRADGPEGNSIADEYASATTDVAGDVLGVEAHGQLPGASGPPDKLTLLKGVGPKFEARLNELGIMRYEQIAALSDNEVSILDDKLGPFKGRIARDRVVEQASYLARGDREGFEERFGNLGG